MAHLSYVQQYGRGYSELLLCKQPIPEKISSKIKLWITLHGLEFHILKDASLYVSGKKPGIFMNKGEGVSHVLVKKKEDTSLWNLQVVSTNSLELLQEALTADAVERIANYINQHNPIADHNEFRATHARLEAELRQKEDEEYRQKQREEEQRKVEEYREHAEAMKEATVKFLNGDDIHSQAFSDMLKFHGLWAGIHPKTKHFIQERLLSVNSGGGYRYRYKLCGKRSQGSLMVHRIVEALKKYLEEAAPAPVNTAELSAKHAA